MPNNNRNPDDEELEREERELKERRAKLNIAKNVRALEEILAAGTGLAAGISPTPQIAGAVSGLAAGLMPTPRMGAVVGARGGAIGFGEEAAAPVAAQVAGVSPEMQSMLARTLAMPSPQTIVQPGVAPETRFAPIGMPGVTMARPDMTGAISYTAEGPLRFGRPWAREIPSALQRALEPEEERDIARMEAVAGLPPREAIARQRALATEELRAGMAVPKYRPTEEMLTIEREKQKGRAAIEDLKFGHTKNLLAAKTKDEFQKVLSGIRKDLADPIISEQLGAITKNAIGSLIAANSDEEVDNIIRINSTALRDSGTYGYAIIAAEQMKKFKPYEKPIPPTPPTRKIRVRVKATGQTGTIEEREFNTTIYERIQ